MSSAPSKTVVHHSPRILPTVVAHLCNVRRQTWARCYIVYLRGLLAKVLNSYNTLTIHERLVREVLRISPQQIPQLVTESLQFSSRSAGQQKDEGHGDQTDNTYTYTYDSLGRNHDSVTLRTLRRISFCNPPPVDGNILELMLHQPEEVLQACSKYLSDLSHDSSRKKCKEHGIDIAHEHNRQLGTDFLFNVLFKNPQRPSHLL